MDLTNSLMTQETQRLATTAAKGLQLQRGAVPDDSVVKTQNSAPPGEAAPILCAQVWTSFSLSAIIPWHSEKYCLERFPPARIASGWPANTFGVFYASISPTDCNS